MGESFEKPSSKRIRGIVGPHRIKGVPYDSLGEACTILGFNYDTIYGRMARHRSITAEEAMYHFDDFSRFHEGKEVTYNGKTYRSIEEMADFVGLNAHSISRINRKYGYPYEMCVMILKTGYPLGQLLEHEGKIYVSQQHLAESHGTNVNRVKAVQKYHGYETFYEGFVHYMTKVIPRTRKDTEDDV